MPNKLLQRKLLQAQSIAISYAETNEAAETTIFFFHGNGNSADIWTNQFADSLLSDYRLIAFDLPSHGQSTAPGDTQCNLIWMAKLMAACVRELANAKPYLLCGISLGGNIIAEMLTEDIDPLALVIIGSNFVGKDISPADILSDPLVSKVLYSNLASEEELLSYFKRASIAESQANQQLLLDGYLKTDGRFRTAFPASIGAQQYSDEIGLLQSYKKPILLSFGKMDSICSPELLSDLLPYIWKNDIQFISDAGHFPILDQPKAFNQLLHDFLEEASIHSLQ